jgi:hypothetical protein
MNLITEYENILTRTIEPDVSFPTNNNAAGKRWTLNQFNKNVIVTVEMEVKIHEQFIELSADGTLQFEFILNNWIYFG